MSRLPIVLSLLVLAAISLAGRGGAQCPRWDGRFGVATPDDMVFAMQAFDDGSGPALYAGGRFDRAGGVAAERIARFDGTSWSALGFPGAGPGTVVTSLAVFDEGNGPVLFVGGYFGIPGVQGPTYSIARWDGTTWSAVGSGLGGATFVWAMTVFDDGTGPALYVGGRFSHAGGVQVNNVAKWDGHTWTALGVGTNNDVRALAVFYGGLYAGGDFQYAGGIEVWSLARWDGTAWFPAGSTNAPVHALTVFDDGAGTALWAGGAFTAVNGGQTNHIARLGPSGWTQPGSGITGPGSTGLTDVLALEVHDDGTGAALYASGSFSSAGGNAARNVARWDGSAWSAVGAGLLSTVWALAEFDPGSGPELWASGEFGSTWVAHWDGSEWGPFALGVSAPVWSLFVHDDGVTRSLIAGGEFTSTGSGPAAHVASWDGSMWSPLGPGMMYSFESPVPRVMAFADYDDGSGRALYAAGDFGSAGSPNSGVIARWDGSAWTGLGIVYPVVRALAVFDDGSGPGLYAGGSFSYASPFAGPTAPQFIARWDGSVWGALGTGLDGYVRALLVFDDGTGPALYAGGTFGLAGGVGATAIARWNGTTWAPLGSGIDQGLPRVDTLAAFDDGTGPALYAGGRFAGAGGVGASNIARWNGSSWSALGSGTNGDVNALAVFDDGTGDGPALYAAGAFTSAGGASAPRVARWDGTSWSGLASGADGPVRALCAVDDAVGRSLFAGGDFTALGAVASVHVGAWRSCQTIGRLFCFGDGSGTACPCGNASAVGDRAGCSNSLSVGSTLRARGQASIASDSLVLDGAQSTNGSAFYFQGATRQNGGAGTVFGDGLRCAGGVVRRLGMKTPVGGVSLYPGGGDAAISVQGAVLAPGTRTYQMRYRNAASFCTTATFNSTNGVEVTWTL